MIIYFFLFSTLRIHYNLTFLVEVNPDEMLVLNKEETNGVAWEDKETESIQYNQVVGNGVYDSGEEVIPNMTTELY